MSVVHIYSASLDNTVRKIDSNGDQVWSFTGHTGDVWAVAVGVDGCVCSASAAGSIRTITAAGTPVWPNSDHTGRVTSVAVDTDVNSSPV